MPTTLGMLELSRVAASIDSQLGHIFPWIIRLSENSFKLTYAMNFKDATNPEFLQKFGQYKGPKNYQDLKPWTDLTCPDLRPYETQFTLSLSRLYGFSAVHIHI